MTEPANAIEARLSSRWPRLFLVGGALLGFLTVAMAAMAAHLPDRMLAHDGRAFLRSAVQMQGWHVPALLACGLLLERRGGGRNGCRRTVLALRAAGMCFLLGILCFCFALCALAFAGAGGIARAAPLGGGMLMLGWLLLAFGCAGASAR